MFDQIDVMEIAVERRRVQHFFKQICFTGNARENVPFFMVISCCPNVSLSRR